MCAGEHCPASCNPCGNVPAFLHARPVTSAGLDAMRRAASCLAAMLLPAVLCSGCAVDVQTRLEQALREGISTLNESTLALSARAASALGTSTRLAALQQAATVGRFGLRIRTSDRVLHLQGLFELRANASAASVDLFDPAGQPILHWRQNAGEAAWIEAAGTGMVSVDQAERWLRQSGLSGATPALNAWQWRRWLDLPEGSYEQGEFLIERSAGRLRIVSGPDEALRLTLVPTDPQ